MSNAQPGMGSDTAVQPICEADPRPWDRKEAAQTHYSDSGEERPQDLIPNWIHPVGLDLENAVTSVSAGHRPICGLAGLESAASSLSEIDGQAPCYPAFEQAGRLRKSHRDGVNCGGLMAKPAQP
jgi:hypothetical protein